MSLVVDGSVSQGDFTLTVSMELAAGRVLGILGPNGSGKTTLIRAVSGLQALSSGSVVVGDVAWQSPSGCLAPQQRAVGLVLAEPVLFPHLSAVDNVAFGPRSRGMPTGPARDRARAELTGLGLEEFADRKPGALSTGQAQRVALARALATDPEVLLLDESLAGLDPQTRTSVRGVLASRLAGFEGCTLMITHDPVDALTLADELLFLADGVVVQRGTPAQVAAAPTSPYAAQIVGLNLLAAVSDSPGRAQCGLGIVHTTAEAIGPVWLSIRPNALSLWPAPPAGSPRNTWRLTVTGVELLGQTARVLLTAGSDRLIAEVTALAVHELSLAPGTEIWASVKATEIDSYPR